MPSIFIIFAQVWVTLLVNKYVYLEPISENLAEAIILVLY